MLPSGLGASDGTVAGPLLFSNALSSSHSCSVLRTAVLEYPEFWLRLAPLHNGCSRRRPRPCRTEREVARPQRCGQVVRFSRHVRPPALGGNQKARSHPLHRCNATGTRLERTPSRGGLAFSGKASRKQSRPEYYPTTVLFPNTSRDRLPA